MNHIKVVCVCMYVCVCSRYTTPQLLVPTDSATTPTDVAKTPPPPPALTPSRHAASTTPPQPPPCIYPPPPPLPHAPYTSPPPPPTGATDARCERGRGAPLSAPTRGGQISKRKKAQTCLPTRTPSADFERITPIRVFSSLLGFFSHTRRRSRCSCREAGSTERSRCASTTSSGRRHTTSREHTRRISTRCSTSGTATCDRRSARRRSPSSSSWPLTSGRWMKERSALRPCAKNTQNCSPNPPCPPTPTGRHQHPTRPRAHTTTTPRARSPPPPPQQVFAKIDAEKAREMEACGGK